MSLVTERKLKKWLHSVEVRDVESGQVYLAADSDGMPLRIFYDPLAQIDVIEISAFVTRTPPEPEMRPKFFSKLCDLSHVVLAPKKDAGLDEIFGISLREDAVSLIWTLEGDALEDGKPPRELKKFLIMRRRLRELLKSDFLLPKPPPLPPGTRMLMP